MRVARVVEIARALWAGFRRDRASMFLTLLFPLLFLFIFASVFGDDGDADRMEVLVSGHGPVLDALPDDVLNITAVDSAEEGVDRVRDGDAVALIIQQGDDVVVHYQGSERVDGQTVIGVVGSVVNQQNLEALGGAETYLLETQQVEDEALSGVEFLTPGMLAWAVSISGVFSGALTLVSWRTKGLLRRLRLTPASAGEIGIARISVSAMIALVQTALFLGVGVWLLDLHLSGPWWMVFPIVLVGTMTFLSIGVLIGALARTVESASAVSNLIVVPMAFVSGAFVPLRLAPDWMGAVSEVMPLTHLVEPLKEVMVRDRTVASTLPNLALLLGFALVFAVLAARMFRWDRA